ncbi:hypothetical protein E4631_18240 [Hymenobacter sp. UV11]|uniref:hypothetical protein n=1 Tax=Hymenobacter sp. UV11 TaxID=1849735 RepID=UPI0010619D0A|nr:hypothetical protein [Hymenobacter sp. UV11]TDN40233.1 hypothetical protein A8B98_15245 [Hymenobacter sp. UV11]TFZ64924.1 hypothetical protein E4631_18240 [Hymenobacter sp. UV11]
MPSPKLPIYFENDVATLREHPQGYVVFEYKPGKRAFTDLQAVLTHLSNLLRRRDWYKILGDQRAMSPFTEQESAWIVDYWLDVTRQRPGGLYAAVLLAEDVFARLAATQLRLENKQAALTYHLFEDQAEAAAWLVQLGQ